MKTNVTFIGMPGSGKSTFGRAVANALAWDFIDTDDLIEQAYGKPLQQQLDEVGYLVLRERESLIISQLNCTNTVIATGGSAVYGKQGMEHLKDIAHIFYLEVSEPVLLQRIDNMTTRGIAKAEDQSFSDMMAERVALYECWGEQVLAAEDPEKIGEMVECVVDIIGVEK